MKRYGKIRRDTGISAYDYGLNWIKIQFINGKEYVYTYNSAGEEHVEQMKDLAQKGRGLSTYISKYVKDLYDKYIIKM